MHYDLFHSRVSSNIGWAIGDEFYGQWLELDRMLIQLWESRSIRPRVIRTVLAKEEQCMRDCYGCLLPEMSKGGILDLVERAPDYY